MKNVWNNFKLWGWRITKVLAVVLIAAGVIYWMKFSPVPVDTYTVKRGAIVAEVMGTGTLEARIETSVGPKIAGRIAEVLTDQGKRVTKGELLVRLDDEELTQQVAIALANVDAASAAIARLVTDKNRADAVYNQARKNHVRVQSLARKNVNTREELDRAIEALAVAAAGVSRAEAAITEGQKSLISMEKTLAYHRARLRDTRISAPFSGLIVKRNREPGDVVVPGSSILTLISTDELWVRAWVDETVMAKLKADQPARVLCRSEPDRVSPGSVVRLGREVDRETREFIVDVRVLKLPDNWAVGQRAETYIQASKKGDTLLLPSRFLARRNNTTGVFVDIHGSAAWREVTLGVESRDAIEIIDGLTEGEHIVTPRNRETMLTDGQRVTAP